MINFTMKTLNNSQAKQLERIYNHFCTCVDKSNDKNNNCLRQLKLIVKRVKG